MENAGFFYWTGVVFWILVALIVVYGCSCTLREELKFRNKQERAHLDILKGDVIRSEENATFIDPGLPDVGGEEGRGSEDGNEDGGADDARDREPDQ